MSGILARRRVRRNFPTPSVRTGLREPIDRASYRWPFWGTSAAQVHLGASPHLLNSSPGSFLSYPFMNSSPSPHVVHPLLPEDPDGPNSQFPQHNRCLCSCAVVRIRWHPGFIGPTRRPRRTQAPRQLHGQGQPDRHR